MKINAILAAGLAFAASLSPIALAAPAAAQRTVVHERTVVRHAGPRYRPARHRVVTRRVCSNRYYHGRRHRVCRTVRRYR